MKRLLLFATAVCVLFSSAGQSVAFGSFGKGKLPVKRQEMTGHNPCDYRLAEYGLSQQSKYRLKQKSNEIPAGMAEIVLEAHDVWGMGTLGYQMLLDADHSAHEDLFLEGMYVYFGDYSAFEYKIPENADASQASTNCVIDAAVSILVPAGMYDFIVLCPNPVEGLLFAHGTYANCNDFEFKDGNSYRFCVEYRDGADGWFDYVDLFMDVDAAISRLVLPPTGMDMTDSEEIAVDIINRGVSAITDFTVSYQVDDNPAVTESFKDVINPGDTVRYAFKTKADFSAEKAYAVKAWVSLPNDMLSENDSQEASCKHIGVAQLPFNYDFSAMGAEAFSSDWIVENVNEDFSTWEYNDWMGGADGNMGCANCSGCWSDDRTGNDNLISVPVNLPAGENHIAFYTKCVNGTEATELLDVRYGKSTDVSAMMVIGDYKINQMDWTQKVVNFTVAEPGIYYFAFHAKSVNGMNVFLDDIRIDSGKMDVSPRLKVEKVLLPYSNCDLSEACEVGAIVSNVGTGATSSYTLTYTVIGHEPVKQVFTDVIEPQETKTIYFDTKADFSEIGEYEVLVEATTGSEVEHANYGTVANYEPYTTLPLVTDFAMNTNYEEYWTEMTPGSWERESYFNTFGTTKRGIENGLLSHCFALTTPVRIKIAYNGGYFDEAASFYVAYGKAGTDVSNYQKVYEDNAVLSGKEVEFVVPITEPDHYSFMIVCTTPEEMQVTFYLYEMTLSAVYEHDLRIENIVAPVSYRTPEKQMKGVGVYEAIVTNRGTLPMTGVKASLYNGETLLGTSDEGIEIASGDTAVVSVPATLPSVSIGDKLNLSMLVFSDPTDMYDGDNKLALYAVETTDTVRAMEAETAIAGGTGSWGDTLSVGNLYYLAVPDTLTSISVGLAETEESGIAGTTIGLAMYEVADDGKTLGRRMYYTEMTRGYGGMAEFAIDPMVLSPGKYFFEVQQQGIINMGLGYVESEDSYCYQNVGGSLVMVKGALLIIRANFGHQADVFQADAAVTELLTPVKKSALYSSDETISVLVKNRGMNPIVDVPVTCKVNGTAYSQTTSLLAYETAVVKFEHIDMSVPGEYAVTVSVNLAGDENTQNDVLTETLVSLEEANPYVMNFETCADFDSAGDTFNPRWWTEDRNHLRTDGFLLYDYLHKNEAVGFMAFNPASTTPAVDPNDLPGYYAHSGVRFGAAFCVDSYERPEVTESDVWLISPRLKLNTNSSLELYVKTRVLEYVGAKLEPYRLLISDTDDDFNSFVVLGDDVREAPVDWTKVEVDLRAYDNKEVYVAVQYIGKYLENVVFMVDDIRVKGDGIDAVKALDSAENMTVRYLSQDKILSVQSGMEIFRIELYNVQGQRLYMISDVNGNSCRVSAAGYPAGVYIARIYAAGGSSTYKFVVR